jgi:hypothetical protein
VISSSGGGVTIFQVLPRLHQQRVAERWRNRVANHGIFAQAEFMPVSDMMRKGKKKFKQFM